jgi:hypothetical protein
MVKLCQFTAVNTNEEHSNDPSTTLEAEEARIIELYESGIREAFISNHSNAEVRHQTAVPSIFGWFSERYPYDYPMARFRTYFAAFWKTNWS